MEQLKDQQRLFEKLFISPNALTQSSHLILSIQFLKLLLEEAPLLASAPLKNLLLKILGLFEIQPVNSLLLYNHDCSAVDQTPLLTEIILACAKAVNDREEGEQYLTMMDSLLAYYPITLLHVTSITRQFALQFQSGAFLHVKSWFLHKVLQKYYGPKKGLKGMPQSFFFFYGCSQTSTIHSFEEMKVKLKQELGVMFSVYLLERPENSTICRLQTNKQSLVITFGKNITITNQTTGQKIVQEEALKPQRWVKLIVNFTANETVIFINEQEICREKPLLKKEKDRELIHYCFGEEVIGFMTGIAISHRAIPAHLIKELPQFKDWYDIKFVKTEHLEDIFLLCCFPFSTFQMRGTLHCFDIFQRIHSLIGQNIILFKNIVQYAGFQVMGGPEVLLPLFYLARFYDSNQYPDHFECLLKIWLSSLSLFPAQEKSQQFMLVLGHHIEALPQLLTPACVSILAIIYEKLPQASRALFLRYVGWSGLPAKTSCAASTEWLQWLTRLYQNNKSLCLNAFGLLDVVYWLVINLENNLHECCPQHYLSEAKVIRDFSLEEIKNLQSNSKRMHFQAVENIAAVILEYYIIDQHVSTMSKVRGILRLLLHKYSPCLYHTILSIFKRQFPKFKDDKALSLFFLEAELVPFLAALAEKTVDADLLALIIYMLLMVCNFREKGRALAIQYLTIVFKRMETIFSDHFNPLNFGAKKVRKRSLSLGKIERQGFSDLIQKVSEYRRDMTEVAIILINYHMGVVFEKEVTKGKLQGDEQTLQLLRAFMPIAGSNTRMFILNVLRQKLEEYPSPIEWAVQSSEFNEILLWTIKNPNQKELEYTKRIIVTCFKWLLAQKIKITDYYILLKTLTKSQIDLTPILCQVFFDIFDQDSSFNLEHLETIMVIVIAESKQSHSVGNSSFKKLIALIASRICSILNHRLKISNKMGPTELFQHLQDLPAEQLKIELFSLEMNILAEEDITFLFDICLPKAAADCDIKSLFTDAKRRVYVFQIFVWSLLQEVILGAELVKAVATDLLWILKIFLAVSLLKCQLIIDKSFLRMVIFMVSHNLCFSYFHDEFVGLWVWIFKLIKSQAVCFEATSYSSLINKLSVNKIQPYLVQIFQTFLRPNNDQYMLEFQQLVGGSQQSLVEFVEIKLTNMLKLKSIGYVIDECKIYAFKELTEIFSNLIRIVREKLDSRQKVSAESQLVGEVESLFEEESIGEQETRIKYLHEHQCSLRQYYSFWKKIWKRLRIYHHPYGLFMAQRDSLTSFQFPPNSNKNFRLKISKFSSNTLIQPILEAQIQEPWHARKIIKRDAKHELSTLVEMARPTHNPMKRSGITQMASNFLRSLRGEKKKQQVSSYEVIWIKRGRKARGKLLVNDNFQLIFWYDSLRQEDSHLSFEKFNLPYNKPMIKKWRVDLIRRISLKRYLMQWHALQLEFIYRKSILFYFQDHKEALFLQEIESIRAARLDEFSNKVKLNNIPLYQDGWYRHELPAKLTEDWIARKINTLSYLMAVNKAASRSILDISQYPIAPWVCQMSSDKQPTIRDLAKSMGALGSQERKKIVTEKYHSKDPFNPVPPFYFGTHYSSPGVVFNYLIRLAPFTDYCKNLQGGKFDIADRLFASLLTAWKSASSEVSDVRQMIPQFFYLPQALLNLEKLRLGKTQCGDEVNNVELPPWAGGNPYFLVAQLRQMLESEQVSCEISGWIDFIFGFRQKGQEAIDNFNVYYYLTYEDYSSCLDNDHDEVYRKSCEAQIIHFGQIPPQVFQGPHAKRLPIAKPLIELMVKEAIDLTNCFSQKPIGIWRSGNEIVLVRRNEIQCLVAGKSPAIMTKSVDFNLQRTISKKLYNIKKQWAKIAFFKKYFLIYGYVTNEFRIFNRNNGSIEFDDQVDSKIEYVLVNEENSLLLVGCQSGLLHIYELQYETFKVNAVKVYSLSFPYSISHISEHDGFFAISFGYYVAIYKIERPLAYLSKYPQQPFIRFFRSFQNSLPVKGAFIADAPLYCLLIYDNTHIKVYSINGQLMKICGWNAKGIQRMVDSQLHSLFCIYEQNRLILVSTPDLRCLSELQIGGAIQVGEGVVVYKNKIHFIDCKPQF